MKNLGLPMPKMLKGVKGLRAAARARRRWRRAYSGHRRDHIFKDGTARFDAMNMPITHFYPKEVGVGVEKLQRAGLHKDYKGNELVGGRPAGGDACTRT